MLKMKNGSKWNIIEKYHIIFVVITKEEISSIIISILYYAVIIYEISYRFKSDFYIIIE